MSNKTTDYALGSRVAELIVSGACPSSQLMALLGDLAESDVQLASAFRMLASHPIFVDSLAPALPFDAARVAALRGLANETLSASLADRVHQFLAGFNGYLEVESGAAPAIESVSFPEDSDPGFGASMEPATLFASPDLASNEPVQSPGSSATPVRAQSSSWVLPIKPLLLLGSIVLIAVSLFKVQALCEPLALCAKKDEAPSTATPDPVPDAPPQQGLPVEPSRSPSPRVLPPQPSQTIPPAPVPAQPSSAGGSQLRDEPLW